jgi:hypothetical protein
MRLCVGTSKGIVILDPARGRVPLMVVAEPCSVWCIAQDCEDPNLLYAGSVHDAHMGNARSRGALARSIDGGRIWSDITPGMARDEDVWAIATPSDRPGEVFIGTSHARIMKSEQGGQNFRECMAFLKLAGRDRWTFPPPPHIPHVRSIKFDPRNSSTFYVGVEEGGVFRSRDGGGTFEPLNHGIYSDIHSIEIDAEDPNRVYATTGRGFYYSESAGGSWQHVNGLNRSYTVPLLVQPGAIYTAAAAGPPPTWSMGSVGADALMFRSHDHGRSFQPLTLTEGGASPMRAMVMHLRRDPAGSDEDFFALFTDGSIVRMNEHGENLQLIADRLPPVYDLVTLP